MIMFFLLFETLHSSFHILNVIPSLQFVRPSLPFHPYLLCCSSHCPLSCHASSFPLQGCCTRFPLGITDWLLFISQGSERPSNILTPLKQIPLLSHYTVLFVSFIVCFQFISAYLLVYLLLYLSYQAIKFHESEKFFTHYCPILSILLTTQ